MDGKRVFTSEQLHYLRLLSKQFPTVQAAGTEIIRLQAILNLPKGTEHFMSDIHGEHEAFLHILNSGSGEVKEKLEDLFGNAMTQRDRNDLATLIYYPRAKLALVKGMGAKVVYANAYTIWNIFAGINDGAGNKAFIPSPKADPVTQGVMYGFTVKLDDNLDNKVMLAGIPGKIIANNFEDLFINHAMDPKTFEEIIAGYSLFDAGLENPLSFVKVTFQ